jgi:hypothetical protein
MGADCVGVLGLRQPLNDFGGCWVPPSLWTSLAMSSTFTQFPLNNCLLGISKHSFVPRNKNIKSVKCLQLSITLPACVPSRLCCVSSVFFCLESFLFDPRRGQRIFPLASVSRPALGPIQPPVQWVPGVLYPGVKGGRGVMLTTHPHLVPRSWMSRSYTSSPPKRLHGV